MRSRLLKACYFAQITLTKQERLWQAQKGSKARSGRWARQGRQAVLPDVPALTVIIVAAAVIRTNTHSKAGGTCH